MKEEKLLQELREVLRELTDIDKISEFCRQYGYIQPYLSNILNQYVRPDGYKVKGSYPRNILILKDAKEFQKKIKKSV